MSFINIHSSEYNVLFILTDFILIYQGLSLLKYSSTYSFSFLLAGFVDLFFHLTGEKYSITQHSVAPFVVYSLVRIVNELFKKSLLIGYILSIVLILGLGIAFIDGAPGLPGYNPFTQPSPKDPHYLLSHIVAHSTLLIIVSAYLGNQAKIEKKE